MSDIRTARWRYGGDPIALPVQCCCDPGRRFGWVFVPKAAPGRVYFALREEPFPRTLNASIQWHTSMPYPIVPYVCAHGRVHQTVPLRLTRLAVSSSDYPIETWRRVSGFVELP